MTPGFSWGASALIFLAGLLLTETLVHYYQSEIAAERHARTFTFASELRARSDRELNSLLYLASGVVGYLTVRHKTLDIAEIDRILAAIYTRGKHVRNFTIAIGQKIHYIYPPNGNEDLIGLDYSDLEDQWPLIRRAIEDRKILLSGRVELVQGGSALIYREPIIVDGKYWGMLSTVINLYSLQKAAFNGLDEQHFEFAIRSESTEDSNEIARENDGMLYGDPALFSDPSAITLAANMLSNKWTYVVRSKGQPGHLAPWIFRCGGWLLSLLMAYGVLLVLRQRGHLARLAGFDTLTELPNRRLFDDRLEQALRRQMRRNGQVAVAFIDVDRFKPINDRYGHKVGDRVLRLMAERICSGVRAGDTVSRWAGDEFAIIIDEAETVQVDQMLERLQQRIGAPFAIDNDLSLLVSVAIGVAFYPTEAKDANSLLVLADKRMYENKSRERGEQRG